MPVICDTAEMPPLPQALLSAATHKRRDLSSNTPSRERKRPRTPEGSPIQFRITQNIPKWKCYFLTIPKLSRDHRERLPVTCLITFACYGCCLHGDESGS